MSLSYLVKAVQKAAVKGLEVEFTGINPVRVSIAKPTEGEVNSYDWAAEDYFNASNHQAIIDFIEKERD